MVERLGDREPERSKHREVARFSRQWYENLYWLINDTGGASTYTYAEVASMVARAVSESIDGHARALALAAAASDGHARSLQSATWVLAAATIVLAFVTGFAILRN